MNVSILVVDVGLSVYISDKELTELVDCLDDGFDFYYDLYNKFKKNDYMVDLLKCSSLKKKVNLNHDDNSIHLKLTDLVDLIEKYSFYCRWNVKQRNKDDYEIQRLLSKLNILLIECQRSKKACIYEK